MRVLINMDGGLIQNITTDGRHEDDFLQVAVVDYDTQDSDPADLVAIPQKDGSKVEAYLNIHNVDTDKEEVDEFFFMLNKHAKDIK